jgi:TM2 domain-containing membrane protein YozV
MPQNAPAGWYPQPDGTERWWDGQAWTAHSRPVPPPPTAPAPSNAAGLYGSDPVAPVTAGPYGTGYAVAPKSPGISLLASFFIPGLGTMINGEVNKGIGILVGYVACLFLFFLLVPLLGAMVLWVWGMVDAYQGAVRWNHAHGIIS